MTIYMLVTGQKLSLGRCAPFVVSDTINYIEAQFTFLTRDWDGLVKWAHFAQGETVYDVLLDHDRVTQEAGLNLGAGVWQVYLHGNRVEGGEVTQRITTGSVELTVRQSGVRNGEPLPPVTATEQILAEAEEAKRIAQSVRDDADAGAFVGDKGDKGDTGATGATGPQGPQGVPGYTPVRGVDYWTSGDQEAIDAAKEDAHQAAEDAKQISARLSDVDMTVTMLPPSSAPTAEVTQTATQTAFALGIPTSNLAYATFEVDGEMELLMHSPEGYGDIEFMLNDGELEVSI